MGPATLAVLCGLPGSGKTTQARGLEEQRSAVRFTPDEWMADLGVDQHDGVVRDRLESRLWALAQQLLLDGTDVILDFGSWARTERDTLRSWARTHGVRVELHLCEAPFDDLVARVEARSTPGKPADVPLSRALMEAYLSDWSPPDEAERALFDEPARV